MKIRKRRFIVGKILTISIAAYNVESYIKENIESILLSKAKNDIEIFVVDDGGNDKTYEIAKSYEEQYPNIVHAIHKENGGYGSVQNFCIEHATGKYFKILDGDDWMDTDGLTKLIEYLKTSNMDVVVTNYYKGTDKGHLKLFNFGKWCKVNELTNPNSIKNCYIGMWALTYKTSILRASEVVLPEHTLYTDRLFATIPFSFIETMIILDFPVYCYRTGRNGQSASRESRIKHIDEYLSVTTDLCRHYSNDKRRHKEYILEKVSAAYKMSIRALLLLPPTEKNLIKLKNYESSIKTMAPEIYKKSASLRTRMGWVIIFMRITGYKGYWILGKIPKKIIDY